MRYLIISDVHSNLAAFEAVLADAGSFDKVWCLGDMVGYGPDPNECVERLRDLPHVCVVGNHDWAALGKMDTEDFNPDAKKACLWTREQLSPSNLEYLESLPKSCVEEGFTLVHGSPREPIWEYIISTGVAQENFTYFQSQYCLVGHSHVPLVFSYGESGEFSTSRFQPGIGVILGKSRLIINPGGVGQPRDGDPRASYAVYDSETMQVKLYRVPYDIRATQDRMVARGLPLRLVARLSQGL